MINEEVQYMLGDVHGKEYSNWEQELQRVDRNNSIIKDLNDVVNKHNYPNLWELVSELSETYSYKLYTKEV